MIKTSNLSTQYFLIAKTLFFAILICICEPTFSREVIKDLNITSLSSKGTIIVLEAPLFEKKNIKSRILQYVRKGTNIFINGEGQEIASYDLDFYGQMNKVHNTLSRKEKLDDLDEIERLEQAGRLKIQKHETRDTTHLDETFYQDFNTNKESISKSSNYEIVKDLTQLEEVFDFNESVFTERSAKTEEQKHDFFKTVDNIGRTAYILKDHVKVLYKDTRELRTSANLRHDLTDYRLEEPLPENYPFVDPNKYRLSASYGSGPGKEISYPYVKHIDYESYSQRQGFNITYTKNITFDSNQRIYFGGTFHYFYSRNSFTFYDYGESQETIFEGGVGPIITFDSFRTKYLRLTLTGAITVNYINTLVEQTNIESNYSRRSYYSFYITPRIGTELYWIGFLPKTSFLVRGEMEANAPYDLEDYSNEIAPAWNEHSDRIFYPAGGNYSLYFGMLYQI